MSVGQTRGRSRPSEQRVHGQEGDDRGHGLTQRRVRADCQNNDDSRVHQQTQTEGRVSERPAICGQCELRVGLRLASRFMSAERQQERRQQRPEGAREDKVEESRGRRSTYQRPDRVQIRLDPDQQYNHSNVRIHIKLCEQMPPSRAEGATWLPATAHVLYASHRSYEEQMTRLTMTL